MDIYRYDEAWELQPEQVVSRFVDDVLAIPNAILIDLRKPGDFISGHIPGAYNLPLQSSNHSTPSPFFDAAVLESQWKELAATFTSDRINAYDLSGKNFYMVCCNGDTARVATSILRAKGITASSIKGGYSALQREFPGLQMNTRGRNLIQEQSIIAPMRETEILSEITVNAP